MPGDEPKRPEEQFKHDAEFVKEKVPAGQMLHVPPAMPNVPALHTH